MPYEIIPDKSEDEYRDLFEEIYCNIPITTFDGITVKFFSNMFNHAFFESENRKMGDKSLFSEKRAERIKWIKDTLEDPASIMKQGWVKKNKSYTNSRRVAIVKNNYVVVIQMFGVRQARFVTAYVADNSIDKILNSPDWV